MSKINTKSKLREYIKRKLGAPLLNVELTDDMLDDSIDRAIEVYSEYAYGGTEEIALILELDELDEGVKEYKLPDRTIAVTHLQASSIYNAMSTIPKGYTLAMDNPMATAMSNFSQASNMDIQSMVQSMSAISSIKSLFEIEINYSFNFNNKILRLHENPTSKIILLELGLEYEPADIDLIYNNQWVKKRAEGEAWLTWGHLMGKYSSDLINGSQINYGDMQQRGETIIDKTDEELYEIGEALGVYIF